ncbi:Na+/citrate or Na+/malate symporter [Brevibacterium sandarakinum]|uniref:Na+/citrate or Na+/malate symporter n=1 Tax=Brevibacterium sandarakinum TaxID=629680 RepID=A0A1H1PMG8_BRESA|nr:2-hydroxycarboxylate transporter family protein [Brevibacterium sandarakinum]SDS12366.1 Na+/citrate or Na+/malate symporter [Brevibacterium sandarakinum]
MTSREVKEDSAQAESLQENKQPIDRTIMGLPVLAFIPMAIIVLIAVSLTTEGTGMTAAFAVVMSLGGVLMWVGSSIPYFKLIGGGVILCILVPAIFKYFGVLPGPIEGLVTSFYDTSGFGEFVVAALITGSILGMPRGLLIKAGARILIPIIATIAACLAVLGLIGTITGVGAGYAIFFVAGPVLGGGVAAGAIPISEIIAQNGDQPASAYLTALVPAVAVANIICIIVAAVLNAVGKKQGHRLRAFNGNGVLAQGVKLPEGTAENLTSPTAAVKLAATGFFLAGALFAVSNLLSDLMPALHAYVFLIVICALIKVFIPLPDYVEASVDLWYVFVANAMIPAILVALSIIAINIEEVLSLISDPGYIAMTLLTVVIAAVVAGFVGWLVKLYWIESAISAGLGLADFGSSGDLAVLQASQRLNLLPFLSISSRIGGGIVLVTLSVLAPYLL